MPVKADRVISELVVDIDDQAIALGDIDGRDWPLSIDTDGRPVEQTIRVGRDPGYVVVVDDRSRSSEAEEQKRTTRVEEIQERIRHDD